MKLVGTKYLMSFMFYEFRNRNRYFTGSVIQVKSSQITTEKQITINQLLVCLHLNV